MQCSAGERERTRLTRVKLNGRCRWRRRGRKRNTRRLAMYQYQQSTGQFGGNVLAAEGCGQLNLVSEDAYTDLPILDASIPEMPIFSGREFAFRALPANEICTCFLIRPFAQPSGIRRAVRVLCATGTSPVALLPRVTFVD